MADIENAFDAMKKMGIKVPPMSTPDEQERLGKCFETIAQNLKLPFFEWLKSPNKDKDNDELRKSTLETIKMSYKILGLEMPKVLNT